MASLEQVVRRIPRTGIEMALGKTERLNLLVTPQQKQEIRATAEWFDLSMTDYLIRLHDLVQLQLGRRPKKLRSRA